MTEQSTPEGKSSAPLQPRPAAIRLLLLGVCVAAIVVILVWVFRPGSDETPSELRLTYHDPVLDAEAPTPPGYVGPQACTKCHAERVKEFLQTNHYRTSRLPRPADMPRGFRPGQGKFVTRFPGVRFEMSRQGDDFVQTAVRSTANGEQRTTSKVDLIYGAGTADDVYFHWDHQDRLFELPMGWLWTKDCWGVSAIDKHGSGHMARPMTKRCLECHNTWFHHVAGTPNQYHRENFIIGVTCESCHGPAKKHVDFHEANPQATDASSILHPGELSRERKLDLCLQCHSNSVKHLGPAFSYRPGKPLDEFYKTERISHHEDDHVANQIHYLRQSKCFQKTQMSCVTCHNPHHKKEPTETGTESCHSCHQPEHCLERERLPAGVRDDCIGCHMPRYIKINVNFDLENDLYVPPIRRYEHRIAAHPAARDEVLLHWFRKKSDPKSRDRSATLLAGLIKHYETRAQERAKDYRFVAAVSNIREALRLEPDEPDRKRLLDKLKQFTSRASTIDDHWADAIKQLSEQQTDKAIKTLQTILSLNPRDSKGHGRLGTMLAIKGDHNRAVEHLRLASQYDPEDPYGEAMIGWLAYQRGRLSEALTHLLKADRIEPYRLKVQIQLAMAYLGVRQFDKAEARLRQALKIDPRRVDACQMLARLLHQSRRSQDGLLYAHRAARLSQYKDASVLLLLSEVAQGASETKDAVTAAKMALRLAEEKKDERQISTARKWLRRLEER